MTLDRLDLAFLDRFAGDVVAADDSPRDPSDGPETVAQPDILPCVESVDAVAQRHTMKPVATTLVGSAEDQCTLEQLLIHVPNEWRQLADCVEQALTRGSRVVAVVGRRRGEGRTTLVHGIARTLESRCWRVACVQQPPLEEPHSDAVADVILVDAGVWFPPGPVRRNRIANMACGCDAVLLVRRADQSPCIVHEEVLESLGLKVLGEAVTFAAPLAVAAPLALAAPLPFIASAPSRDARHAVDTRQFPHN